MGKVIHFEIPADDLDRASKFYTDSFGWKANRWGEEKYVLLDCGEGDGINGAIMPRTGIFSEKGTGFRAFICTIEVEDLAKSAEKIKAAGGKVVNEVQKIPHVGTHQFFTDTEGNTFGILQPEKK